MDIPINAEVYCTDGLCGRSTRLVIDPKTADVTHLVVKEHRFPHTEFLVPLDNVAASTIQRIDLHCRVDELARFQPLDEVEYMTLDQAGGDVRESMRELASEETIIFPYFTSDPEPLSPGDTIIRVRHEMLPPGELAIQRGAEVIATDGRIGRVDDLEVDPQNGHITHMRLLEGHLWGKKHVIIPVSEILRIEEDRIYLKLGKEQVETLPSIPARGAGA